MDVKDQVWRRRQLDVAVQEISEFADGCRDKELWCARRAGRERRRTRVLTLSASVVATVAGAGALSQLVSPVVSGVVALASAVLGTVATFFSTDPVKLEQLERMASAYGLLVTDMHQWARVDALDPHQRILAVEMLRDFSLRQADIEAGLPLRRVPGFGSPGTYGEDLTWVVEGLPEGPQPRPA
ncbi:hypothetical protein [Kribbella sp. NPDC050470]|uniref:hypothetical protein n=1 Tax=unclassified Kribbella TaxID=2644121 RepID=UPI00379CD3B3